MRRALLRRARLRPLSPVRYSTRRLASRVRTCRTSTGAQFMQTAQRRVLPVAPGMTSLLWLCVTAMFIGKAGANGLRMAAAMFEAFSAMRKVNELMLLLRAAQSMPLKAAHRLRCDALLARLSTDCTVDSLFLLSRPRRFARRHGLSCRVARRRRAAHRTRHPLASGKGAHARDAPAISELA